MQRYENSRIREEQDMNQGFIKVAAGTPQITVADCKANTKAILELIHEME